MTSKEFSLNTSKILARVEDGIGWLTFNNPERRNAMSLEMWEGLAAATEAFQRDPAVKVIVMKGAGGKAFVSGADISEFDQHRSNTQQKQTYARIASRGQLGLANLDKPLVAMIEGYCIGGGLGLALHADVRFASHSSRFGIPAAKLGLGYDYSGVAHLARLVGPSIAKDLLFTARFVDSAEALAMRLVNFVVESPDLEYRVRAYASAIAANAPLTVGAVKEAVRVFEQYSLDPGSSRVDALVNQCFDSDDYREGRLAFSEKRTPQFAGR